jgi:hypothetical protein
VVLTVSAGTAAIAANLGLLATTADDEVGQLQPTQVIELPPGTVVVEPSAPGRVLTSVDQDDDAYEDDDDHGYEDDDRYEDDDDHGYEDDDRYEDDDHDDDDDDDDDDGHDDDD